MARALKAGIIAGGFGPGTGPSAYYNQVLRSMGEKHLLCNLEGACPPDLDLVHIIDAKRADLHLVESLRVPVIADFHDDYWTHDPAYPAPDLILRKLRRRMLYHHHLRLLKTVQAVVVHSEAVRGGIVSVLQKEIPEKERRPPVFLVPLASPDLTGLKKEEPAARQNPPSDKLILMVGRDLFRKGFPVLVKAMKRVVPAEPSARVVVVGKEFLHARIAARVLARGLPVRFAGLVSREELNRLYLSAAALALPSWEEGFGLVLLEAMAAGLPVAASRAGGIPEAVEHGVSGFLHEPGDHEALAEHLLLLLRNPEARARVIEGGKKKAEMFSLARMAEELNQVWRKVAEANR